MCWGPVAVSCMGVLFFVDFHGAFFRVYPSDRFVSKTFSRPEDYSKVFFDFSINSYRTLRIAVSTNVLSP